ncbi:sel1 repeat family protein [Salmonella enterica]|nr:sel1 repeat family protein [Salmonella enterica]
MRVVNLPILIASTFLLAACQGNKEVKMSTTLQEQKLQFTCTKEADHLPPLDPQADIWFKQARAMEKAPGVKNYDMIGSLYRQAIAKDHYKAMRNLQNLLLEGLVKPLPGYSATGEAVEIVEKMIKLNIPAGYYAMGYYLENGYGVKQDKIASLAFYRKAADLGNPEGQYVIGNLLMSKVLPDWSNNPAYRPDIGKNMLDCSANQWNGDAAYDLGNYYKLADKNYVTALKYYQLGVKNGYVLAALQLTKSFNSPDAKDTIHYLDLTKDPERVRRYTLIEHEIDSNPSARFPDIDKIVPLPPADLPKWDGTFEYKKEPQPQ